MGSVKTTIQIDISSTNPFEAKTKMMALKDLSKLDNEALTKLVELAKKPVAIAQLKTNFETIKTFLSS